MTFVYWLSLMLVLGWLNSPSVLSMMTGNLLALTSAWSPSRPSRIWTWCSRLFVPFTSHKRTLPNWNICPLSSPVPETWSISTLIYRTWRRWAFSLSRLTILLVWWLNLLPRYNVMVQFHPQGLASPSVVLQGFGSSPATNCGGWGSPRVRPTYWYCPTAQT